MRFQSIDEDAALRARAENERNAARNRQPEPYWEGGEDSGVNYWRFPRAMRDADIRAEVRRQGWDPEGYPCRCAEGDCCGASFARELYIEQGRRHKVATQFVGRCI